MEEKKDEQPKVVINIQTAYNVNPAATKVENTFIIGSNKEGKRAMAEAVGGGMKPETWNQKPGVDTNAIRPEILKYVSRILPLLHDEHKT